MHTVVGWTHGGGRPHGIPLPLEACVNSAYSAGIQEEQLSAA